MNESRERGGSGDAASPCLIEEDRMAIEHGIVVPEGTEVRLIEGPTKPEVGAGQTVLPLPSKPSTAELSDAQLDGVSGGVAKVWEYIKKNNLQDKLKR